MEEEVRLRKEAVLLLSGGVDSTTLLYDLVHWGYEVHPVSFYYGQKHEREVGAARLTCMKLGLPLKVLDVGVLGQIAPSALTRGDIKVPEGYYEDGTMRATVVPNRNMVFVSLAAAYAIGLGVGELFYAAHGGDHSIYPDCRPAFVIALSKVLKLCDYLRLNLEVPYLYWTKGDIVRRGVELGVDYSLTWSCYVGGDKPCGRCGTCVERAEAFEKAGVKDPLV